MVFKLVHIDSENPYKIKLESGIHIYGRGKFFNVNDKRISRNHVQFEVTDESLTITPLHQNPCFYQKSGTSHTQVLNKSSSITLKCGDKLGLLPTSHWYEVLRCVVMEDEENKESHEITIESEEATDNELEIGSQPITKSLVISQNNELVSQSTVDLLQTEFNKEQNSSSSNETGDTQITSTIEQTCVDKHKPTIDFGSNEAHMDEPGSPSLLPANQETKEKSNDVGPHSSEQFGALQKRSHVTEENQNNEVKKMKTEPADSPDVKSELDSPQAGSSNSNDKNKDNPGIAAAAPQRERCMYGASCYRRNPNHRAQFSHPQDDDWGTGEKAPCPWGAACRKRDPRHWRDHDHPPGKEQPPPQAGARVVYRQGNVFYINAHTVNFYDDHVEAEDSDGNSVDYDYEF